MLIIENKPFQLGMVVIMSDLAILVASAKTTLLEIAKQAGSLGAGLQIAAPGDKLGMPNHSVQYLLEISEILSKKASECEVLLSANAQDSEHKSEK